NNGFFDGRAHGAANRKNDWTRGPKNLRDMRDRAEIWQVGRPTCWPPSAQAGVAKADCFLLTGREKNEVASCRSKRSAIPCTCRFARKSCNRGPEIAEMSTLVLRVV